MSGCLEARIARMVEQRFSLTGSSGQPLEAVHTRSAHSWNIVVKGLPTFLCLNIFKIVFKTRKFRGIPRNVSNLIIFCSGLTLLNFHFNQEVNPLTAECRTSNGTCAGSRHGSASHFQRSSSS